MTLLLRRTVLATRGNLRLFWGPRRDEAVLGGWDAPGDPLPLANGRYLRLTMALYFEDSPAGRRAKVRQSSFQYQLDRDDERWVFRYDYLRRPFPRDRAPLPLGP